MTRAGAILLAAGSASRMGRLKQLLPYRGKTLVEHALDQAIVAGFDPIVVIVGAGAEQVKQKLTGYPAALVDNPAWESGMGSSLAVGVRYLHPQAAVAVLLADQPLVTASHLQLMLAAFQRAEGERIVAAFYNDTLGVPAIFPASLLPVLQALKPEAGARTLLRDSSQSVESFSLPEAAADIDTPDDLMRLAIVDHG